MSSICPALSRRSVRASASPPHWACLRRGRRRIACGAARAAHPALRCCRRSFLHLPPAIREKPLRSVQAPHFKRSLATRNRGGISPAGAGNDGHARAISCSESRLSNSRTPAQGRALKRSTRNGERAVVVQQQQRVGAPQRGEEILQLVLFLSDSNLVAFYAILRSGYRWRSPSQPRAGRARLPGVRPLQANSRRSPSTSPPNDKYCVPSPAARIRCMRSRRSSRCISRPR